MANSETTTFSSLEFLPTSFYWTEKNLFTILRPGKICTYMNTEKELAWSYWRLFNGERKEKKDGGDYAKG